MKTKISQEINIIGISVRTDNQGNSLTDIPELWNKFISDNIPVQIPGKINNNIYCIYTSYELDHTRPYTTVLGCQVKSLDNMPEGMVGVTIKPGFYKKIISKGNTMNGSVYRSWQEIWNSDLPRTFITDFEVYGEKAQNPEDSEVEIFVGIMN